MYSLLSNLPFGSHLVIQKGAQTIESPTWGDVFTFLQSRHFHAEGDRKTPHAESLWDHLTQCGEFCFTKAQSLGLSEHDCKKAYFAGFLHDIGKPATLTASSTRLSFKGHGLVGGAILENAWTPALGSTLGFTAGDWADLSMLADVHMCGYFPHQCEYRHDVGLQILPATVKRLLPCLRWGDMSAMVSTDSALFPTDPVPDEARFLATLFAPLDTLRLAKEKPKGILIQLCGASGAGKSSLARWLKEQLDSRGCRVTVVSRDHYIVRESLVRMNPSSHPYHQWDGILTPTIYRTAYDYYVSTGKAYSADINAAMKRDIQMALQERQIVLLDTLMTMYPQTHGSILPACVDKAFQINLWVHRNCLFTEEEATGRLGLSLESQVALHGDTGTAWNPFLAGLQWRALISNTE